jgi:uncharacterized repeat protein (TIGR03833 family)
MGNSFPTRGMLTPGMTVVIVEKHNQLTDEESVGKIDRILTRDSFHPHGIKVMLTDGRVGRVKRIVNEKLEELNEKLKYYEDKLAREMIGYRGVIHESAASEIKHDKVMVLRAMVDGLKEEIAKMEK